MKLGIDPNLVAKWRETEGLTLVEATAKVKKCLRCSDSKAEKISAGRYPSHPTPLERAALARLMRFEESALFPVPAGNSEAS